MVVLGSHTHMDEREGHGWLNVDHTILMRKRRDTTDLIGANTTWMTENRVIAGCIRVTQTP